MMMQHEFAQAVCISLTAYLVGIYTYEHAATYKDRWLGRIAILMSVVVLIAFGHYAVEQCAVTQDELAALKNKADSIYQVASVTDFNVTLASGTNLQWSKLNGRRGPLSITTGRGGSIGPTTDSDAGGNADASRSGYGVSDGTFNATSSSTWNADAGTGKAF